MTKSSLIRRTGATITSVVLFVALPSCESSKPETDAAQPQVDPRYASAEAIVTEYNRLMGQNPPNILGVADITFCETPLQKRLVAVVRDSAQIMDFNRALQDRFPDAVPSGKMDLNFGAQPPATIVDRMDRRVRAVVKYPNGHLDHVDFVEIGDRWWLSGYTMEYQPTVERMKASLDDWEAFIPAMAAQAPSVTASVRAGRYATPEQARRALVLAAIAANPELRDRIAGFADD
jgi:hypothetical protein